MKHNLRDRVLALAGVFQAATEVKRVAVHGREANSQVTTAVQSIFKIDADSVEDVYAGAARLRNGLQTLVRQMGDRPPDRDVELTRYVITLLYLERKLAANSSMLDELQRGIEQARIQSDWFSETHPNVIANLADLYQKTISTLKPRIMVSGNPEILANPENASMIRMLLLAGIRSAVLWRQCGGSRWQLIFKRKVILGEAGRLLKELPVIDKLI